MRRFMMVTMLLTLAALGLRLFVALAVASDCSGDGPVYRQIAENLLEHHGYSLETEDPYLPTLIRMPGYPLVLAAIFAIFGKGSTAAVYVVQAVADTATCWAAALLCALWAPRSWRRESRRLASLWAFALLAACPFTLVYAGTLLTETWALLFGTLCVLAGSWALKAEGRGAFRWALTGLLGGTACLFRPDMGLVLAALGAVLVGSGMMEALAARRIAGRGWRVLAVPAGGMVLRGLVLSVAFVAVLAPWVWRNARTFGLFQPLSPPAANMPGEFVPVGYSSWVTSWLAQPKYIEYFIWPLDEQPMDPARLPPGATDSTEERERVRRLFNAYNRAGETSPKGDGAQEPSPQMTPGLDAEFGAIARERAAAHPVRQHVLLPARRAWNLWFDTHSVYYRFDGDLFPLSQLSVEGGQLVLLPLFYLMSWMYAILGLAGATILWRSPGGRRWAALLFLLFVPRLVFLATLANPEPRYMVEMLPFVAAAGGIALAFWRRKPCPGPAEEMPLRRSMRAGEGGRGGNAGVSPSLRLICDEMGFPRSNVLRRDEAGGGGVRCG